MMVPSVVAGFGAAVNCIVSAGLVTTSTLRETLLDVDVLLPFAALAVVAEVDRDFGDAQRFQGRLDHHLGSKLHSGGFQAHRPAGRFAESSQPAMEMLRRALEAGKHVLCEKPLALNVAECRRMIAAAKRNRRLLMEAFMYRFHPQTLKIQEIIRKGAIGEVRVIRAGFGFSLNESAKNVRLGKRMGGGSLWLIRLKGAVALKSACRRLALGVDSL